MTGIAEALSVAGLAVQALTAHERKKFYEAHPWAGTDTITVQCLDLADTGDIRYSVKGVNSRFNRIDYQETKCIPESELKKLMEDFEE